MKFLYGIGALSHLTKQIWLKTQERVLILAYHRIAELNSDPQLLSVRPDHFAEHLEYISEQYHPISLVELGKALAANHVPHRSIVVTFDDGYADNLWNAIPLLKKYSVPATVFVTTGHIGQDLELWWDELERLILLPKRLPDQIVLEINGKNHVWDLSATHRTCNDGQKYPNRKPEDNSSHLRWNVTMSSYPSPCHKIYNDLHNLLRPKEYDEQEKILNELAQCVSSQRNGRLEYRVLNKDEIRALSSDGLIEIGSHTITHPVLKLQSLEVQRKEITDSKLHLENIIEQPIRSISYPFGNTSDFGKETIRLVSEAGYGMGCANFEAPVTRRSNPYCLPRFLVRDWTRDEFARRLRGWFCE